MSSTALCLTHSLSPHFSTPFPTLARCSSTTPSLFYPSASPSTATLQGVLCFGRLAEQSLSQVMSPSLTSKSAASTLRLTYTRTATISRTLWMRLKFYDTADVGRLTSPLFSREREVSAIAGLSSVFKRGEILAGR